MAHPPAQTIWELGSQLKFDEPLEAGDERFVDTRSARGDFSYDLLLKPYGIDTKTYQMKFEPSGMYSLFCGHRGCGKSTELRRLRDRLNRPELFFVVFLDVLKELDVNNLSYSDVLLAAAKALITRIGKAGIDIDKVHLRNLENWFTERIERHEATKDFAAEISAGLEAKHGIPFLAKIFAQLTSTVRIGSTHKEELRRVIANSFTQFADAFQNLIDAADEEVRKNGKGRRVLFIIDGTDRLRGEDSDRFFIRNAYQLLQLRGNFIYGAPIHLSYEKNQLGQVFVNITRLPMIKVEEKGSNATSPAGIAAMREVVYKRADSALFDSEETVDYLIRCSGGNPRDLLHLLLNAYKRTDTEKIDCKSAEAAVKDLATDYRRTLNKDDYQFLFEVDSAPDDTHDPDKAAKLLSNLTLLEYNSFWWRSHPVVRTLPGYIECMSGKRQEDET